MIDEVDAATPTQIVAQHLPPRRLTLPYLVTAWTSGHAGRVSTRRSRRGGLEVTRTS